MTRIVLLWVVAALVGAAGCSDAPQNTTALTAEQKAKLRQEDQTVDDEERSGSGTATKAKKKK